jgi:ergothioneine biosynthesis protein EgtB
MEIVEFSREIGALKEKFLKTQEMTDHLFDPLSSEDCGLSVTQETSPPKWHLGHTSWFYAQSLLERFSSYEISPELAFLFNSFDKGVGDHIPKASRRSISRPGLVEVRDWRNEIRQRVVDCLDTLTIDDISSVRKIMEMGIHHEQQHQELILMDVKRNFFENPLRPRYKARSLSTVHDHNPATWINIPSGLVTLGVPLSKKTFHYDNEGDSHKRWIDSFMLMSHPVTNEEFLNFVKAGGYATPRLWLSDGWKHIQKEGWKHPLYWDERDGEWWHFTLWGMVPLDLKAPVCHLSYYEADALARFSGARLPTEFEWETASLREKISGNFQEQGIFEPMIVDDGDEFAGIHGTVWEWTQSAYLPYPRYENFPGDLAEYNEKFMVNQMVLRGGSCLTPTSHYRHTYRNFYYPHMRWQYGGIRLAKDLA